ncbi:MAG TPA: carboxypeptidase-like regulatory domain-containing protein [Terriglobia bacterium]|nr:carboxypeptidase-like regulatory domain-containing protein [Terriglobia bacterium]
MNILRYASLLLVLAFQNTAPPEPGIVQGTVTRVGTNEPIADVQVSLEGGAASPQATQSLLNAATAAGIPIAPPQGASLSEITQLITNAAAARGLPLQAQGIQSLVTRAVGTQSWPTVITGQDGKFAFRDIVPGRYTVRATRDGFFGKPAGTVYPPTASIDIVIAGKDTVQASLAMAQGGIIGGRINDTAGEVVPNINVQAFSVGYQNGFSLLQPAVTKTTDDRGEYRLFWVPPGEYFVGVTPPATPPAAGGLPRARTFYPGVTRLNDAMPITIRGGEDLRGIDIAIRTAPLFKISGQVTSSIPIPLSPTGEPVLGTAFLHLADRDLNTPNDSTRANQAGTFVISPLNSTGTFEVAGVAPGSYELLARVADPSVGTGLAAFSWGRALIEISDHDVKDVAIAVTASPALKGTVRATTGTRLPPNLRIVLTPMGGSSRVALYGLVSTRGTTVAADGSFAVAAIPPGQFRIGALPGLPQDLFIADVRQNGVSVFDSGFDIGAKEPNPIEILISGGAGVVEGTVADGPSKIVPGATVVLAPEPRRMENRALVLVATADAMGRFAFHGVAPGDYQLLAWETAPANAYQSVAYLKKYESRAKAIHVNQSATVNAELAVIR